MNNKNYFSEEIILPKLMKFTEEKDGHKLWTGFLQDGYGQISLYSKKYLAHRISAFLYLGLDLTDKAQKALHKPECKFRNCWNPEHLYVGTAHQNIQDSINTGTFHHLNNQLKTHCLRGHEYNEENTRINSKGYRACKECDRIAHRIL